MGLPRWIGGNRSAVEQEADNLLAMSADDHLGAAAMCQARASNPDSRTDFEVSAAQEQRAQTHLLWAIATMLYDATQPPASGG